MRCTVNDGGLNRSTHHPLAEDWAQVRARVQLASLALPRCPTSPTQWWRVMTAAVMVTDGWKCEGDDQETSSGTRWPWVTVCTPRLRSFAEFTMLASLAEQSLAGAPYEAQRNLHQSGHSGRSDFRAAACRPAASPTARRKVGYWDMTSLN